MDNVLVIGSYNVGLTVLGDRIPKVGQTVIGNHFDMGPGGKGSIQAIAISRLGGNITFLAKIGDDIFAKDAMSLFQREGIDTTYVKVDPDSHTGVGIIFVDKEGHNSIGVAPGANYKLTTQELDDADELFKKSKFLLIVFKHFTTDVFNIENLFICKILFKVFQIVSGNTDGMKGTANGPHML